MRQRIIVLWCIWCGWLFRADHSEYFYGHTEGGDEEDRKWERAWLEDLLDSVPPGTVFGPA